MKRIALYSGLVLVCLGAALISSRRQPAALPAPHPGLEVYIGEGCIHCHSQYRRPTGIDRDLWGDPSDLAVETARQQPVLFGNRRQGPDLSNIGDRRSRDWNRIHLERPRDVRANSRMPDYSHLFSGDGARGEALLDYLQTLGGESSNAWMEHISGWQPETNLAAGDIKRGSMLYREYCAGCHGATGRGNGRLALSFVPAPRDLTHPASWLWIKEGQTTQQRTELARLIKFGRPGTSMAGTEWLDGQQLADLIRFLETLPQASEQ